MSFNKLLVVAKIKEDEMMGLAYTKQYVNASHEIDKVQPPMTYYLV